eukprot:c21824_g1_i1 orf=485-1276(-)
MHQVVKTEKTPAAEAPRAAAADQKLPGASVESAEKWLLRSFVLIRWMVRAILIRAWASYLHDNFKGLISSWATISVSLVLFSLLLYVCSLLYLRRFARHALSSVSLNRCLALFNLLWSFLLFLTGLTLSFVGPPVKAEDKYILPSLLSMYFYPHAVIASFFTHLLTRALTCQKRLSRSNPLDQTIEPPPEPASICSLFLQVLLITLWFLYPIARIYDSDCLTSPYILTFFVLSTLIATVSFIVFFCSATALVFSEHEGFPTLL